MKTLTIQKDNYRVPSEWNEMNPEDLSYLAGLSFGRTLTADQVKLYMMLRFLGARVRPIDPLGVMGGIQRTVEEQLHMLHIGKQKYMLTAEMITAAADKVCGFLLEEERDEDGNLTYRIAPRLTRNPYPKFWFRGHHYTGGEANLYDLTFEQYMYLCTYLDALKADPKRMDGLLACVWHNEPRWSVERMEYDAAAFYRMQADKKLIMYWYIVSSMEAFADKFPRLFSGGDGSHRNALDNQLRLLNSLADGDMTKKDAVRRGLLMDAFYSMDESVKAREEMERKMKQ